MDIAAVLAAAVQSKASDVHLQEGRLPLLRLGAELFPWGNHRVGGEDISAWLQALGQPFDGQPYVSTAFSWDGRVRCRLHASREQAGVHVVVRMLYPLDTLPPDGDEALLRRLSGLDDGLVLVCGPTGSGKTTTLWRILRWANADRRCHIISLEDPIEYVVPGELALISQREYGIHFQSFAEANREDCSKIPKARKAHKFSTFGMSLSIRTFAGHRHEPPYLLLYLKMKIIHEIGQAAFSYN